MSSTEYRDVPYVQYRDVLIPGGLPLLAMLLPPQPPKKKKKKTEIKNPNKNQNKKRSVDFDLSSHQ